jgi:hypothetical protein
MSRAEKPHYIGFTTTMITFEYTLTANTYSKCQRKFEDFCHQM